MRPHAPLSASASKMWLSCTPSARLQAKFAEKETTAAAEGTAAHALAEYKVKRALRYFCKRPVSEYEDEVMDMATDDYAAFILESMAELRKAGADPTVMIETRLDFSDWVPDGFGTGDCIIIGGDTLHIVDLKYGAGVLVESVRREEGPDDHLPAAPGKHLYRGTVGGNADGMGKQLCTAQGAAGLCGRG